MSDRTRRTPEQAVRALERADRMLAEGRDIAQVCGELGISRVTYDRWRRQFGRLSAEQAKRLKDLEQEIATLTRLLAEAAQQKSELMRLAGSFAAPAEPAEPAEPHTAEPRLAEDAPAEGDRMAGDRMAGDRMAGDRVAAAGVDQLRRAVAKALGDDDQGADYGLHNQQHHLPGPHESPAEPGESSESGESGASGESGERRDWLTRQEACALTGIAIDTLRQWLAAGLLPRTWRVSKTLFLYHRDDLERIGRAPRRGRVGVNRAAVRAAIAGSATSQPADPLRRVHPDRASLTSETGQSIPSARSLSPPTAQGTLTDVSAFT